MYIFYRKLGYLDLRRPRNEYFTGSGHWIIQDTRNVGMVIKEKNRRRKRRRRRRRRRKKKKKRVDDRVHKNNGNTGVVQKM